MPFFLPATFAVLGALEVAGSIAGGKAGQKAADINAQAIGIEGAEQERRLARDVTTLMARTETQAAAQGAAVDSGSVQAVLADTLAEFERERDYIKQRTELRQRGAELEGDAALWGGIGRAVGGATSGALRVASSLGKI